MERMRGRESERDRERVKKYWTQNNFDGKTTLYAAVTVQSKGNYVIFSARTRWVKNTKKKRQWWSCILALALWSISIFQVFFVWTKKHTKIASFSRWLPLIFFSTFTRYKLPYSNLIMIFVYWKLLETQCKRIQFSLLSREFVSNSWLLYCDYINSVHIGQLEDKLFNSI